VSLTLDNGGFDQTSGQGFRALAEAGQINAAMAAAAQSLDP
jgi:hypothetical protein